MKNRLTPIYKSRVEQLKSEIIIGIKVVADSEMSRIGQGLKIDLEDNRGSLVINQIDDQESEVIQSIERLENNVYVVWSGVYEEDTKHHLRDFDIPTLINILDAIEAAIENE